MLKGKNVVLRPVRETDLPFLVDRNAEFEDRGDEGTCLFLEKRVPQ